MYSKLGDFFPKMSEEYIYLLSKWYFCLPKENHAESSCDSKPCLKSNACTKKNTNIFPNIFFYQEALCSLEKDYKTHNRHGVNGIEIMQASWKEIYLFMKKE